MTRPRRHKVTIQRRTRQKAAFLTRPVRRFGCSEPKRKPHDLWPPTDVRSATLRAKVATRVTRALEDRRHGGDSTRDAGAATRRRIRRVSRECERRRFELRAITREAPRFERFGFAQEVSRGNGAEPERLQRSDRPPRCCHSLDKIQTKATRRTRSGMSGGEAQRRGSRARRAARFGFAQDSVKHSSYFSRFAAEIMRGFVGHSVS